MVSFENGIDSVIQSLARVEGERWSKLQRDPQGVTERLESRLDECNGA